MYNLRHYTALVDDDDKTALHDHRRIHNRTIMDGQGSRIIEILLKSFEDKQRITHHVR